ncbi:MAG: hypothetical protein EG828_05465 [Deltaproteobacteria bacterium]|nr:hypothetical protein [Deltaproteobacteria bacterium]
MTSDAVNAIRFYQDCDSTTAKTIAMPFFNAIHETLEEIGFSEEITLFSAPPEFFVELQTQEPQMAFRPGYLLLGLALFIKTSMGDWIAEKTYDYVFEEKLAPAIEKLKESLVDEQKRIGRASKYCFDIGSWYEPDRVYVLLKVYINSPEDLKDTTHHFRKAQTIIHKRVQITKEVNKVFIFEVTDGALNEVPQVTDKIPGRQPGGGRRSAR